ncbi:MAG: hypothetical protein ABI886_01710 [Betaproteobacteria bacterium]
MMDHRSLAAWLRPLAGLVALTGMLVLSACGGGSGAPNNPYSPTPPIPAALQVLPVFSTAYQGTPATLTVSGGVDPYRAFSSNTTVLPVAQAVAGTTVLLLPNAVAADTTVNITVQDSAGTTFIAQVSVKPAPLLPNLITVTPNTDCPAGTTNAGNMCSGGTGTATVVVTGPTGAGIPGRQVRFDVIAGTFGIQSSNPATPLVQTLTVVTDANGTASVGLSIPVNAVTQVGSIRATDVTTGNQVTGQFTIQQVTDGSAVLSVIPSGNTTITGPLKDVCSFGARVTHYIFGGTPPYQVRPSFPDAVSLTGVPVLTNGGGFDTITNGTCFVNLTYAITDATGRTLPSGNSPTVTNSPGSIVPTPPTPPTPTPTLVIAPTTVSAASCPGKTFTFVAAGGTPSYSVIVTPTPASPPAITAGVATVSGLTTGTWTVTIYDQGNPRQTATATITCT